MDVWRKYSNLNTSVSNLFLVFVVLFCSFILFQKDEVYLNLVLDFVPETVYRVARHYSRAKQTLPVIYVKVWNNGTASSLQNI